MTLPHPCPEWHREVLRGQQLEREITELAAHINAANYRFLRLIGEFALELLSTRPAHMPGAHRAGALRDTVVWCRAENDFDASCTLDPTRWPRAAPCGEYTGEDAGGSGRASRNGELRARVSWMRIIC